MLCQLLAQLIQFTLCEDEVLLQFILTTHHLKLLVMAILSTLQYTPIDLEDGVGLRVVLLIVIVALLVTPPKLLYRTLQDVLMPIH